MISGNRVMAFRAQASEQPSNKATGDLLLALADQDQTTGQVGDRHLGHLSVDLHKDKSYVAAALTSRIHSWVLGPYSYTILKTNHIANSLGIPI